MPGITNPFTYHAANTTVLDGSDDSDDEVSASQPNFIGTFIESVEAIANSPTLPESPKEISLLIGPYFGGPQPPPPDSLPVSFDCLLDNGSHLNLICDS